MYHLRAPFPNIPLSTGVVLPSTPRQLERQPQVLLNKLLVTVALGQVKV